MMNPILLDVAPDPVSTGIGIAGLAFVAIVVVLLTAAVLLGAVFLFRRIRKAHNPPSRLDVRQSSPNQP
jgi:hypothetical protein